MFTETPAEPSKDWITLVNTSYWLYQLPFSRLMSAVGTDHILLASIVQDTATYWRCYEILRLQNNVGLFRDSTAAMEHPSVCVHTCCSVTHAAPSRLWQCDSGWYSRLSPELQSVLNAVARLIYSCRYEHVILLLHQLHWLSTSTSSRLFSHSNVCTDWHCCSSPTNFDDQWVQGLILICDQPPHHYYMLVTCSFQQIAIGPFGNCATAHHFGIPTCFSNSLKNLPFTHFPQLFFSCIHMLSVG